MVRLKDIAACAGVSVMTVSKVLRDAPDISPGTKVRVRHLAQKMGYVPDSMAQGLRTRTTKLFGLIVSSLTNPFFAPVTTALEERAFDLGYELLLGHSLNSVEREEILIRRFLARRVDGLFIAPVYRLAPEAPVFREIKRRAVPTVILGHRAHFCQDFPNVETEDLTASAALTRHLIELGHRRIATFTGPPAAPWAHERLEGYQRALREAKITVDDALIFNAGSGIEDGEKAALQMLNENIHATAIQAANDLVAMGAANLLLNQGFRIPEDISIAGFGNVMLSEVFRVPLTTVRQPKSRLGTIATELMVKLIRGENTESRRLPQELVIRSSCGPAPASRVVSHS